MPDESLIQEFFGRLLIAAPAVVVLGAIGYLLEGAKSVVRLAAVDKERSETRKRFFFTLIMLGTLLGVIALIGDIYCGGQ